MDNSTFVVLALSKQMEVAETTLQDAEGIILLFNAENAVPLSTWSVTKVALLPTSLLYADMLFYLLGFHIL